MIKDFLKNNWCQIFFNILLILAFILEYGHFGDIIIDSFREAYIPERILNGKVLYKNVFCIYGALGYQINALLFYIFGASLNVLYFAGFFASAGILNTVFKISENFMPKIYGLGIVLFVFSAAVISPNVFNFIFPYSYGMLYGLFFILLSLYFCLKKKYFLTYLMYSAAVCCKYEYILLLPFLFWMSGKKDLPKNVFALLFPVFVSFLPLFIQGLTLDNLITQVQIILLMMSTKTVYWFYSISGLVFRPEILLVYLIDLLKIGIPVAFLYFFRHWTVIFLAVVYGYFVFNPEILVFAFPLILILLIFKYKNLSKEEKFVIFASLAISMKVFFALTLMSYGVFFIPFALISLYILLPKYLKKAFLITILAGAVTFSVKNINILNSKNIKIETHKGIIYTLPDYGYSVKELTEFIQKETGKDDRVYILPECLAPNFLADRISDDKFYSLIPMYIETFGEDVVIQRIKLQKPEYIVISNYDTSNYYYSFFGQDYANKVYEYILNNYEKQTAFGKRFVFIVYKKKNDF